MPMLTLKRLAILRSTLGSSDKYFVPATPRSQFTKKNGVTVRRESPSMPAQPQYDGDMRSAGPPRAQLSQSDRTNTLPPIPRWSHTLFLSSMCVLTLPPTSVRSPAADHWIHSLTLTFQKRQKCFGLRSAYC